MKDKKSVSKQPDETILVTVVYCPNVGAFSRTQKIVSDRHFIDHWYHCRDLFHNVLWNLKLFFFSVESSKWSAVAGFMRKIEENLDVQPRSSYGPTQLKKIMWIKPSVWWTGLGMRRSLFTILLRAGMKYVPSKDNFEEAIQHEKYLSKTPYAFQRFMMGFTKYAGRKRGWFKQFCDMKLTNEEIDKLLIKPQK